MTLIALWRTEGSIQIASDSRLTVGSDHVDTSIKITSVPIRALFPGSAGLDHDQTAWEGSIGLCAAGDIAPTAAVKESLRALMDRLWIVPGVGELSMDFFATIVAVILEPLWLAAADALGNDTAATVVLAGYCPRMKIPRAFVLRTDASGFPATIRAEELTTWEHAHYFGSGASIARHVARLRPELTPVEVIEAISQRRLDPAVGGRIQYGKVVDQHFRSFAVLDIEVDTAARTFTSSYYVGAIELMNPDSLPLPEGVQLLPRAIMPFEGLRDRLHDEHFVPVDTRPPGITLIDGNRARELRRDRAQH